MSADRPSRALDPVRVEAQLDELEHQVLGALRRSRCLAADNAALVQRCATLEAALTQVAAENCELRKAAAAQAEIPAETQLPAANATQH